MYDLTGAAIDVEHEHAPGLRAASFHAHDRATALPHCHNQCVVRVRRIFSERWLAAIRICQKTRKSYSALVSMLVTLSLRAVTSLAME